MATTLNSAINAFVATHVDLSKDVVSQGRKSRDWLLGQLGSISENDQTFPRLYKDKHRGFGSFARNTKKQPLDDIDQLWCLSATDGMYYSDTGQEVIIVVDENDIIFKNYTRFDNKTHLSSTRIINLIVRSLSSIQQYKNASERDGEAATLRSTTHDWNFDIVPCFFTAKDINDRDYYLIPDGKGNWKKTDPRKDQEYTSRINQENDQKVLQVIRVIKYWNKRKTMPSMSSYLLENFVLNHFEYYPLKDTLEENIIEAIEYIAANIHSTVYDPKDIQGNLNNLTSEKRNAIFYRALSDLENLKLAKHCKYDDPKKAIDLWRKVFGQNFPEYKS
ncbi:hypothetical protein [Vibrio campbellii]|uniref:hypothetical protein n=1 Tax=Vibrio campbellii TaxID=680 RepID=UPI003857A89F